MKHTLLIFGLLWALGASGQIYINSYAFGAAPAANLLLDDYPNAAAAYSLRKLRTAYTGDCIVVRRSSNNDTLAIGFSGNYLDTAALKTFCSGTNCFVRRWYDQTGNLQDGVRTIYAEQPQIVSAGALVRSGNEVAINFAGRVRLDVPNTSYLHGQSQFYVIAVNTPVATPPGAVPTIFGAYTSVGYKAALLYGFTTASRISVGGRRIGSDSFVPAISNTNVINTQILAIGHLNYNAGTANLFENTVNTATNNSFHVGTMDNTSNSSYPDNIGGFSGLQEYEGFIHELIIYASNQSANRTGIESNINSFYNIY